MTTGHFLIPPHCFSPFLGVLRFQLPWFWSLHYCALRKKYCALLWLFTLLRICDNRLNRKTPPNKFSTFSPLFKCLFTHEIHFACISFVFYALKLGTFTAYAQITTNKFWDVFIPAIFLLRTAPQIWWFLWCFCTLFSQNFLIGRVKMGLKPILQIEKSLVFWISNPWVSLVHKLLAVLHEFHCYLYST